MNRTSLVKAKARHGKPAAAIVPVKVAEESARYRLMTEAQAEAFLDDIAAPAPRLSMSIDEALGRDRLGNGCESYSTPERPGKVPRASR